MKTRQAGQDGAVRKAVSVIAKNPGVAIQCSEHQLTGKGQKENWKGRRKPHRKDEEIQSNITFQSSITTTQRLPPLHRLEVDSPPFLSSPQSVWVSPHPAKMMEK